MLCLRGAETLRGSRCRWPRHPNLRTTIHAVTALEAALLDLLGHFLGVPRRSDQVEGIEGDAIVSAVVPDEIEGRFRLKAIRTSGRRRRTTVL
jgi:hypothetical protein